MSILQEIWQGFDFSSLFQLLERIVPALFCITLHEVSHGLCAYLLGDTTAKDRGRLTLNPIRHIDIIGLLMMVVFRVGWAKPVPINMYRFKNPKRGMAVTALAGPLCNLLITIVFLFLYGALYLPLYNTTAGSFVLEMLMLTAYMSLGLCLFNLIPFPPLDGSKIVFSLLDNRSYGKLMRYEQYFGILFFALFASGVLSAPLSSAIRFAFDKLMVIAQSSFELVGMMFYR